MSFTSREEYGLLAVMRLAMSEGAGPIQAREIARLEDIPEQFLEQVLGALRRAGIVRSIRGAAGGYELARSPRSITAGDVIRALSGDIMPIPCTNPEADKCAKAETCVVVGLRKKLQSAVIQILDGVTIADMIDERAQLAEQASYMMNI